MSVERSVTVVIEVAPHADRGLAMGVAGIHSDAAARRDFIPWLLLEGGVVNDLALCLRQVIHVTAKDVVEPVQVVLGAPHRGRGRVVLATGP